MSLPGLHLIAALKEIVVSSDVSSSPQNTLAIIALVTSLGLIAALIVSALVYKKYFKYRMPRGEFHR